MLKYRLGKVAERFNAPILKIGVAFPFFKKIETKYRRWDNIPLRNSNYSVSLRLACTVQLQLYGAD